jgi:hypothetical protein
MVLINPYAVMRNTATHEAYKAYMRGLTNAGAPLFLGMMLPALWLPFQFLIGPRFDHATRGGLPLFLAWSLAPAVLAVLLVIVGALRIARYKREHPIPDEWRQVPPIKPLGGRRPVA